MFIKIVTRTITKHGLKTVSNVINSAPTPMVSCEFIHFPLLSSLFVLPPFYQCAFIISVVYSWQSWLLLSIKKKKRQKEKKKAAPSSNWPMWRLETTRGSKRYEDNRGFIKMFASLPEERAVRTGWEGEGNHLAQTSLTKKKSKQTTCGLLGNWLATPPATF